MLKRLVSLLTLLATLIGLSAITPSSGGLRSVHAAGTCGGTIGMTPEINPGYDYLAIRLDATGVTGCTAPLYEFAFWNGASREVFQNYSPTPYAYWDTHNLTGQQ